MHNEPLAAGPPYLSSQSSPGIPSLPTTHHFGPAWQSIFLRSLRPILWVLALTILFLAACHVARRYATILFLPPVIEFLAVVAATCIIAARLFHETLVYLSRRYMLTPEDARATSGVIGRRTTQMRVLDIAQIVVDASPGERVLGLGTVLLSSAGSHRTGVAWVSIAHPAERAALVREHLAHAQGNCTPTYLEESHQAHSRPIVIGLVGGIGAGKSTVARHLAQLGCLIIDSDRQAREAIDLPHVKDQLVRWWGGGVLNEQGNVNRKAVADIVFADPTQRTRLEALVHPIVKSSRVDLIGRATLEAKRGVVIDAPLLFEAGSDKECDAIIFVDAPLSDRLARVASRGWNSAELSRREQAQLSIDEKRARAHAVIVNDASPAALEARVKETFTSLLAKQR